MSASSTPQTQADRSAAYRELEEPITELARMTSALRIVLWAAFELDHPAEGDLIHLTAPRISVEAAKQSMIGLERLAEGLEQRWHAGTAADGEAV